MKKDVEESKKTNDMELFSLKLRRLIEELNLTIEAFANQNDVTPPTVYNMLSGRKPSINFINKLIRFILKLIY